jgi:hypothetical protein
MAIGLICRAKVTRHKNRRNRETPSGHRRRRKSQFAFCGKVEACEGLTADAPHLPMKLSMTSRLYGSSILLAAIFSQLCHDAFNDWVGDALRQLE